MQEPPIGAIYNGRVYLQRLRETLGDNIDFINLSHCFDNMAEWIEEESDGWEPSEAQQGLIPIPDGYNED